MELNNKGFVPVFVLMMVAMVFPFYMFYSADMSAFNAKSSQLKSSVNLALEGATLQIDPESLAGGNPEEYRLNTSLAEAVFYDLFLQNADLNPDLTPKPESYLDEPPQILDLYIYNGEEGFPYMYYSDVAGKSIRFDNIGMYVAVNAKVKGLFITRDLTLDKVVTTEIVSKE